MINFGEIKTIGGKLLGKIPGASKAYATAEALNSSSGVLKTNLLFAGGIALLGKAPVNERLGMAGNMLLQNWLVSGIKSPAKQMAMLTALQLAPHTGTIIRSTFMGYRNSLEARSMASVPFSYNSMAMDLAYANLQESQVQSNNLMRGIGGEASWMAARVFNR